MDGTTVLIYVTIRWYVRCPMLSCMYDKGLKLPTSKPSLSSVRVYHDNEVHDREGVEARNDNRMGPGCSRHLGSHE